MLIFYFVKEFKNDIFCNIFHKIEGKITLNSRLKMILTFMKWGPGLSKELTSIPRSQGSGVYIMFEAVFFKTKIFTEQQVLVGPLSFLES